MEVIEQYFQVLTMEWTALPSPQATPIYLKESVGLFVARTYPIDYKMYVNALQHALSAWVVKG